MKKFLLLDTNLLLYGFAMVFFASFGQTFYIALFNDDILNIYKITDGEFGLVYAIATLVSSFLFINFAKLIDKIDLRLYSIVIIFGLAIACTGFYFIFDNIFHLFIILFLLRFFGQGAMMHAGTTSMARYFSVDRGKAISFATLGGMLAIMFLPKIVVHLNSYLDFKTLWILTTIILLILIPIVFLILYNQKNRDLVLTNTIDNDKLSFT